MDKFKILVFKLENVQETEDFLNRYPKYSIVNVHYYFNDEDNKDYVRYTLELKN